MLAPKLKLTTNSGSRKNVLLVILVALFGSSYCLRDCIKQNFTNKNCTLCYQTYKNHFGSCTPYSIPRPTEVVCDISSSNSTSSCLLCNSKYYKSGSRCLNVSTPLIIPGCFSHLPTPSTSNPSSTHTPGMLCSHCLNGFPNPERTSCLSWDKYTGTTNLANCEVSSRQAMTTKPSAPAPSPSSSTNSNTGNSQSNTNPIGNTQTQPTAPEPTCYRCKKGFSYDLIAKACVASTIQGCWEVSHGKCQSCQAWYGWFSDGLDADTGGVKCLKAEDHPYELIVIPPPARSNIRAQIFNRSESIFNKEQREEIEDQVETFAEFKDGFFFTDESFSIKQFLSNSAKPEKIDLGEDIMPTLTYKYKSGSGKHSRTKNGKTYTASSIRCFFSNQFCMMIYNPSNNETDTRNSQRLFLFNATNPLYNGDIYINEHYKDGKRMSQTLPIAKSNYIIIGFSTVDSWPIQDPSLLLRLDYLNTDRQFGYKTPSKGRVMSTYYLYYIEYSNYFLAGITGNGVLAYDLTKSSVLPAKQFNKDSLGSRDKIAYLEGSRTLLINPSGTTRIYGYGFFDEKKSYHISLRYKVQLMVPFKASDFYIVVTTQSRTLIEFYNLGTLVNTLKLNTGSISYGVFSEFYGQLVLYRNNLIIKLSAGEGTLSPSCEGKGYSKFSFTNKGCSKCSAKAMMTAKGVCEMSFEPSNLPYLTSAISGSLPINTQGQKFELKLKKPSPKPPSKFWSTFWFVMLISSPTIVVLLSFCIAGCFVLFQDSKKAKKKKIAETEKKKKELEEKLKKEREEAEKKRKKEEEEKKKKKEAEKIKLDKLNKVRSKGGEAFNYPPNSHITSKMEQLMKENEKLKASQKQMALDFKKKEREIQDKEQKLNKEKEALGLIKGEIKEAVPVAKPGLMIDSERIPFKNIDVKPYKASGKLFGKELEDGGENEKDKEDKEVEKTEKAGNEEVAVETPQGEMNIFESDDEL